MALPTITELDHRSIELGDHTHSTAVAARPPQVRATQTGPREGGQEGECMKDRSSEEQTEATVPATATRASSDPRHLGPAPEGESPAWEWVDREIWTERMLAALATASKEGKGNKWFSLIDKVWRESTLQKAWKQVRTRRGAAGIDGISIARFEAASAQVPRRAGRAA